MYLSVGNLCYRMKEEVIWQINDVESIRTPEAPVEVRSPVAEWISRRRTREGKQKTLPFQNVPGTIYYELGRRIRIQNNDVIF
ncbi:unnamed protein product [Sphenostylis stenocarpa]|uniref:Uncharacterized protein n=1 Tax=Sphenostylis stenocarpa TaxID=92480 RepID=A0AA86S7L8_9FABA|nr:unnamed protein product [Sphenostylis stenocarpa]